MDYQHIPLPPGRFIRCFTLAPGRSDDELVGSLHVANLDDSPEYETISYVWGSPDRECSALCDGSILPITVSLRDALRRLRMPTQARVLWADAICINQDDLGERSHQVGFMGAIYSKAVRTLICVGRDEDDWGWVAASVVTEVAGIIESRLADLNESTIGEDDPIMKDQRWTACSALLRRPWFKRGWVIQEVALSRQATIIWGRGELDWSSLAMVLSWIRYVGYDFLFFKRYMMRSRPLHRTVCAGRRFSEKLPPGTEMFRLNARSTRKLNLPNLLDLARDLGLSDPRDRVYAFLDLAALYDETWSPGAFPTDYQRGFLQVYHDFASQYIRSTRYPHRIIRYVQHTDDSLASSCPSWVPRWDLDGFNATLAPVPSQLLTPAHGRPLKLYRRNDGGPLDHTADPLGDLLPRGHLRMRGVVLDTVALVHGQDWDDHRGPPGFWATAWRTIVDREAIVENAAYDGSDRLPAFLHTIVAGGGNEQGYGITVDEEEAVAFLERFVLRGSRFPDDYLSGYALGTRIGIANPGTGAGARLFDLARDYQKSRSLFVLERGYYALGPAIACPGDICCILFDTMTPFIIRATDTPGHYKLLGEVYVTAPKGSPAEGSKHSQFGLLGYEGCKLWSRWGLEEEDIVLC